MSKVKLEIGQMAPAFDLPRDGQGNLSLASLRGRKAVLYFYPKDDTSGCTKESIDFNALKNKFEKLNTAIIGISPDSVKSHDKFKVKHGLDLPLVSDEGRAMLEAYGVWTEKSMYGRKYMGVERTTVLVDAAGKIIEIWRKVKVPGHAEAVLEAAGKASE